MVAPPFLNFFYVLSVLSVPVQAVDARVPVHCSEMSLLGNHASRTLPPHPGQACALAEGKKWALQVRRTLPADWLSLLNGVTPRTLLQYTALSVPVALVFQPADEANGVPGTRVKAQRAPWRARVRPGERVTAQQRRLGSPDPPALEPMPRRTSRSWPSG